MNPWSSCSATCGNGTRTRTYDCECNIGAAPESDCVEAGAFKPPVQESCAIQNCLTSASSHSPSYGSPPLTQPCKDVHSHARADEHRLDDRGSAHSRMHGCMDAWMHGCTCTRTHTCAGMANVILTLAGSIEDYTSTVQVAWKNAWYCA